MISRERLATKAGLAVMEARPTWRMIGLKAASAGLKLIP